MKVFKNTILIHSDNPSKIFEVALVKVSDQYPYDFVVSFRQGIKGTPLKEGQYTDQPIKLNQARRLYQNIIKYKIKKGYVNTSTEKEYKRKVLDEESRANQKKAILNRLNACANGKALNTEWKPSRVIWRVGEFALEEAIPALIKLADVGDALTEYSIAWALGRIGSAEGIPVLERYVENADKTSALSRISKEALLAIYSDEQKQAFLEKVKAELPKGFGAVLETQNFAKTVGWLREQCYARLKGASVLPNVYLFAKDNPIVHRAVLEIIKDLPFKPNYFKGVRYLFKAAEFRKDGKLYGLIAYRFEKTTEYYKQPARHTRVYVNGQYISDYKAEVKKKNSRVAYSDKTRAYMKRRVWRTLRKMGDAQDADYVKMAVGVLLPYNDETDNHKPFMKITWTYDRQSGRFVKNTNRFDTQSEYVNLFHILYGESPRYLLRQNARGWVCTEDYRIGQPAPEEREESFPHLWDKLPQGLVHLLAESKAQRIHDFAIKALKAHTHFEHLSERIGADLIIRFLANPFKNTNQFALELATKKYTASDPDRELVLALLHSTLEEAFKQGQTWVNEQPDTFLRDTAFLKELITSPNEATRQWIAKLLPVLPLDGNQQKVLIGRLLAFLLQLETGAASAVLSKEVSELLLATYPKPLAKIGLSVINDLVKHPLTENQVFGGELLKNHQTPAEQIPENLLQSLLNSEQEEVRKIGIALFGQFSDTVLFQKEETLVNFCVSPLTDVRAAVRPIVKRLADKNEVFGEMLVGRFAPMLLKKEAYEGVHEDLKNLLLIDLETHLHSVERKMIFRLLNSKRQAAQTMGVKLVQAYVTAESLSVRNIIRLAGHEMLSARKTAWRMFNENAGRMRYEREEAIRLLDSDWDDSRNFAQAYFKKHFTEKDWTPELLVGLCDSVRSDIQQFGKEMIEQFFQAESGTEYLLKLSQHPTSDLQVFASQYLTKYATDNLDHLKRLELYFVTVLSRVNKGRVAKARTFEFLRTEAMKNRKSADVITEILNRISATAAIGDKASCIEILRDIQIKYPKVETVLEFAS